MSVAINNVTDTGVFDQIKHGVINTGNWIGRQVEWLASSVKNFVLNVIEAVKPFFASVAKFVGDQSAKVRDFIVANKEHATLFGAGIALVAIGGIVTYLIFGRSKEEVKADDAAKTAAAVVETAKVETAKVVETAKK